MGDNMQNLLRLFVAIEMPGEVKDEIERIERELKKMDLFDATYVKPEVAHLTLQFVGYIEPSALAPIKKILQSIKFAPIKAETGKVGFFGDKNFIKIIWLEVVSQAIVNLANKISKGLSLESNNRSHPFHSHVTIARIKSVKDRKRLIEALANLETNPVTFASDEFELKQSVLTPEGPIYIDLERYKAT
jgi:2'-5' RNA ligase